jgi:hypothetical protein
VSEQQEILQDEDTNMTLWVLAAQKATPPECRYCRAALKQQLNHAFLVWTMLTLCMTCRSASCAPPEARQPEHSSSEQTDTDHRDNSDAHT